MEIKLTQYSIQKEYNESFKDELRKIWWKTYYSAIIAYSRSYSNPKDITVLSANVADATIEMISPGTKMVV